MTRSKPSKKFWIIFLILILLTAHALNLSALTREVQALNLGEIAKYVDIPDPNLSTALRQACNKPPFILDPTPLTNLDLAKLTGPLHLDDKGIKNLEGVQYCINVSTLHASKNSLTTFPDMTSMAQLQSLQLNECQLTAIPSVVSQLPNLDSLLLAGNQIKDMGALKGCKKLRDLYMPDNQASSIPAGLGLSSLVNINLTNNKFASFPEALLECKQLSTIDLGYNALKSLPEALGKMSKLSSLYVDGNQLSSLPSSLGSSNISKLTARGNLLTSLPDSLFKSKELDFLDVSFNSLTRLPDTITQFQGDYLDLRINYLDVSAGSKTLQLIKKLPNKQILYEAQLTPIRNLKATPEKDRIKLTWNPCQDVTSDPVVKAYVSHYDVYLKENNKLSLQGTIPKSASPSYTDIGLSPGTKRDYSIAVTYELVTSYGSQISRHYSSISGEIPQEETTTTTTSDITSAESTTTTVTTDTTSPGQASTSDLITTAEGIESTEESGNGIDSPEENDKVQTKSSLKWIILGLALALITGALLVWFLLIRPRRRRG